MRTLLRDNGLTIAVLLLFAVSLACQSVAGFAKYNEDQQEHDKPAISFGQYVISPAFAESVFENWESQNIPDPPAMMESRDEGNNWARLLAYVTGLINQELLLQNEYLAAENRIFGLIYRRDCACPIQSGPHSLRSASDSAARR